MQGSPGRPSSFGTVATRLERRGRRYLFRATETFRASRQGLCLGPENFCFARQGQWSVVVDAGVGRLPTFAPWIRAETGAFVVLCDPTPKHLSSIRAWVSSRERVGLIEAAVAAEDGSCQFFESDDDESGTLAKSHINRAHAGRLVPVRTLSLRSLVELASHHGRVELVKLDLEGAEFEVLSATPALSETLLSVPQWLIEFHPAPQTSATLAAVGSARSIFKKLGFREFSRNGVDHLFWQGSHS